MNDFTDEEIEKIRKKLLPHADLISDQAELRKATRLLIKFSKTTLLALAAVVVGIAAIVTNFKAIIKALM